jgi:hypothetical protein
MNGWLIVISHTVCEAYVQNDERFFFMRKNNHYETHICNVCK